MAAMDREIVVQVKPEIVFPELTAGEIDNRFTYHPPHGDQPQRYEDIRAAARVFARQIAAWTPASREQSNALTALDEVVFWANAAIARREDQPDE